MRALKVLVAVAIGCVLVGQTATAASADPGYVQLGTKHTSTWTTNAVRTTMTAPGLSPQYPSGDPWKYYWISQTFANGDFFQAGYADPPLNSQCSGLEWLAWALDGSGNVLLNQFGGCVTSGTRTFEMINSGCGLCTIPNTYAWRAQLDSSYIGSPLWEFYSLVPVNSVHVVSEVSSANPISHTSPPGLSTVTYAPSVQYRGSGAWQDLDNGSVYRATSSPFYSPCPPYEITAAWVNATVIQTDTTPAYCYMDGHLLWS